jgi:ABC-type nitrate/sulfonate/bicarbonate transport system ATPase subunit
MAHGGSGTAVGAIKLTNVAKDHTLARGERLRVLDDITFETADRSFTSILGPSGCGKSTILNLIAGLDNHSAGQISIDGTRIGFVFQQPRLLNWRTVAGNVVLPLEQQYSEKNLKRDAATRYLKLVGLAGYEHYYPLQLSGGMQQRVAIARALAIDPDILLMDEPFSGLDEITARKLRQELLRIWQETGKTILFVTHSISESVFLSQQILIVSPKPARIFKRITIDLPYPREYGDLRLFEIETQLTKDFLGMDAGT